MRKLLKLMADYHCYPLWDYDSQGYVMNIDPENLPISMDLKKKLNFWADTYDNTLCIDDPIKSGFQSNYEEKKFREIGIVLAQKLSEELGVEYEVIYES